MVCQVQFKVFAKFYRLGFDGNRLSDPSTAHPLVAAFSRKLDPGDTDADPVCGSYGIRTRHPFAASEVLYQMS